MNPQRLRFLALAIIGVGLLALGIALTGARDGRTPFGSLLGGDYAAFYVAGQMPASQLYDRALQDRLVHELLPAALPDESLPFAYPPFVATMFRPLAMLPYRVSYVVWLLVSLALYIAGVRLVLPAKHLWLALAFEPFLFECWIGGQLSAIGFFAAALAWRWRGRFAGGLALGLCFYKPTLLAIVLPALLIGRQWRMLLGVCVTGLVLLALSWNSLAGYVATLGDYARATTDAPGAFRVWKFVDARSFLFAWFGRDVSMAWPVLALALAAPLWWQWRRPNREALWAATWTVTLVANVYVGIYDSILIVLSAAFLSNPLLALLFVVPWISQAFGLSLYTPVLAAAGIYQLVQLRRDSIQSPV